MSTIRSTMPFLARSYRHLTQVSARRCMTAKAGSGSAPGVDAAKVPGLSKNVVDVPNAPVGPGAAKDKPYKNPEYFCYNVNSYAEAEVEMAKFRCPQPSSQTPSK